MQSYNPVDIFIHFMNTLKKKKVMPSSKIFDQNLCVKNVFFFLQFLSRRPKLGTPGKYMDTLDI